MPASNEAWRGRGKGLQTVGVDMSRTAVSPTKPEKEEQDDGDLPGRAEFVNEWPKKLKQMEAFGGPCCHFHPDTPDPSPVRRVCCDSSDASLLRKPCHNTSAGSPRRVPNDSSGVSSSRRCYSNCADRSRARRSLTSKTQVPL